MAADKLSRRERQCLELAGQGLSAKEISRALGDITDQTVETYLKRARRKLGVSSSLAGAHVLTRRPHMLDVPPAAVVSGDLAGIIRPAGRGLQSTTRQALGTLWNWLPLRKAGDRHNVLTTGEIIFWIVRLTVIGAITISVAAAAMAMVGFIWFQDFRHFKN